eukprot:TRINITY_DN11794_c0_g1_i4.p1 TRINITY_DN11794_c0_g1~~TRINITY_DN11794_c0_g1_i4.p1  ORF type:complete len:611 (+),score=105.29 TRINITY_DN11794_c0_g1_i4:25-1857(+)
MVSRTRGITSCRFHPELAQDKRVRSELPLSEPNPPITVQRLRSAPYLPSAMAVSSHAVAALAAFVFCLQLHGSESLGVMSKLQQNGTAYLEQLQSGAAAFAPAGPPATPPALEEDAVKGTDELPEVVEVEGAPEAAGADSKDAAVEHNAFHSVQLQKQYVPVTKNNEVVAYKTAYFGSIHIGNPDSSPFRVVFDTGSGHLVLPASSCVSETCQMHRTYNRSASASAVDIEFDGKPISPTATERDQVAIAFGTGEVTGEFVRDVVCLSARTPTLAERQEYLRHQLEQADCVNLQVVLATEMTEDPFGLFNFDGVFGLGLTALTLDPRFSFFPELLRQRPGLKPMFAVFFSRHDEGENVVTFGGYDEKRATSEIQWAPIVEQELGHWSLRIKQVRVGETVLDDCNDGSCRAILDTGTSLIGVPRSATRNMHRLLARAVPEAFGQDPAAIDCRMVPGTMLHFDLVDGPTVSLTVEEFSRPTPFNMTMPNKEPGTPGAWRLFCRSLLLPLDEGEVPGGKAFIWGEPFLRRYFTVYDVENQRAGFSVAAATTEDGPRGLPSLNPPPEGSHISGAPMLPPWKQRPLPEGLTTDSQQGQAVTASTTSTTSEQAAVTV